MEAALGPVHVTLLITRLIESAFAKRDARRELSIELGQDVRTSLIEAMRLDRAETLLPLNPNACPLAALSRARELNQISAVPAITPAMRL